MQSRAVVMVIAVMVSGLTTLALAGHGPWAGSTILTVFASHGLNQGDLLVLAAWLVSMACCVTLWRRLG